MPAWPHIPDRLLDRDITPPRPSDDPRVRWLDAVDAGPFRIWHKAYRSDFTQGSHAHHTGSVDFNIAGSGSGSYLGRDRPSLPGAVEHYRAGGDHSFRAAPRGIRVLHVLFSDHQVAPPIPRGHDDPFDPDEGPAAGLAARILRELSAIALEPGRPTLALESLAHELLAAARRWPRLPDPGPRAIARAADILRASPSQPVSLADLARHVDLHPSHLARAFRLALGVTPGEYHRRLRIAQAAKRLATGNEPIAGVAGELGFADQAHLTRWFTRCTGLSPALYRRTLRS